jgi:hypothetical protein
MAGYIGTTPVPQATQHRESFTATGGQTSFATVGYTPQFIDVYLNGVKLAPADFTATNGSDVVLASGATASDILEIVAYTPFEVANQTFTGTTTAANFTVTGAFTSQGIDDNADAVAITIDSSENVGIGTSTPHDLGSSFAVLNLDGSNGGAIAFSEDDNATDQWLIYTNSDDSLRFAYGSNYATEAMRIDSSGNLLVGKTSTSINTAGSRLIGGGSGAQFTADGTEAVALNRLTSDGDLIWLGKAGSKMGSIGVGQSSDLYIGTSDTGILTSSSESITPWNPSTNVGRDDAIDLGTSDHRFQDLFLSGGVYLGGTGSANKLDDYEEGTWTPTFGGASFTESGRSISSANYVKVGELVHVRFTIDFTGTSGNFSSSDSFYFTTGLPFTNNVRTSTGSTWSSANWVGGVRATGTAMAYDTSVYCGFEYSGGLSRSSRIYVALTYRHS